MSGHELRIEGLRVGVPGREILQGVDLVVRSGQVHAVMGPNGSGKSTLAHAVMGRPGYQVLDGSITLDGVDLLALPTWERARAGLFIGMQHPIEVPGVSLAMSLAAAADRGADRVSGEPAGASGEPAGASSKPAGASGELAGAPAIEARLRDEAARIGFDRRFLDRPLNVDLSGGERKRNETVQLGVLRPSFAILDEIDSGLDIDALAAVAKRMEDATVEWDMGVLAITHFRRLLDVLRADVVHVLSAGRIVASGGPELAEEVDRTGYAAYR